MDDRQIARILHQLRSGQVQEAWSEFLQFYSPSIFQVVRWFEQDADRVGDCFLYVCEQLSRKRFRRLRRFQPKGPASFVTWLRAVVRNLCLDWHRKEFGRKRVFQSLGVLSATEQEIFRCVYEQGMPWDETVLLLQARFPNLTREQVAESCERIQRVLTPHQLFWLSAGRPKIKPLGPAAAGDGGGLEPQIAAPGLDPESLAALQERHAALARALSRLPASDRLLIRLRFEHELTLEEVGRVTKSGDAQTVARKIRAILERLRSDMA